MEKIHFPDKNPGFLVLLGPVQGCRYENSAKKCEKRQKYLFSFIFLMKMLVFQSYGSCVRLGMRKSCLKM